FHHVKNGLQSPINLTIPETRTLERLAAILENKLMLDSATIIETLTNEDICSQYGYDTTTVACMLIPNTYSVYWDTSMENFLKRMHQEHKIFWNEQRLAKAKALDLTPDEVYILASIIDEETSNNEEKPMIAGMYLNRLKANMPLQADPTIKFALQDFTIKRIYHKMLLVDSPYNTYRYEGLPPGPIKIASIAGIDAVLNRIAHPYLYMCAKEDFSGTHNFAVTYQEHLKNAEKYTKALNERGIE
ncbi:MAG: endolytic transglycosylase MltG, partial [Prevotella sp.]|nr:endolytic transglycosylase MltG [Prevotella sp.]